MRYFFDIRDDFYSADDADGEELSGIDAAHREAVKVATSIAGDVFVAEGFEITVTVRDEERPIFEVSVNLNRKDLA
ncbi:DUF6894 family protein [Bradyrhizobium japonicum]|uniref:DUF6894 family protein n=1 Tax=Bradyrhizobium japonicum TaxID=375 RepID=UPI00271450EE|nr:hypothetical protein [Bradyrhizobium japonicum]WLB24120.1 hypothetical protein QIH95_50290 [Bradyrhizobium japonicum]